MNITCIIIDDEEKLRYALRSKIEQYFPNITILDEASNVDTAFQKISLLNPDLIFLDIAMPKQTGFDLLKKFKEIKFEVIFVTGYDSYAIDAIQFCALGYVLKPIELESLTTAIDNAMRRITSNKKNESFYELLNNVSKPNSQDNKIGLPTASGLDFIKVKDIIYCEGSDKYTKVHIDGGKILLCTYNIGVFKNLLASYNFYLSHKSYLINLTHIDKYNKEGTILMSNQGIVPVSVRKRAEFLERIERL